MNRQPGRGGEFDEFEEKKDEMVLNPNPDYVKKNTIAGGAIPLEK